MACKKRGEMQQQLRRRYQEIHQRERRGEVVGLFKRRIRNQIRRFLQLGWRSNGHCRHW